VASWVLPFEALYQAGLASLTADTVGFTRLALDLGPFGGAEPAGAGLWLWAVAYLALVGAAALAAFNRRDL
jgi:Cu-processing system permease protein